MPSQPFRLLSVALLDRRCCSPPSSTTVVVEFGVVVVVVVEFVVVVVAVLVDGKTPWPLWWSSSSWSRSVIVHSFNSVLIYNNVLSIFFYDEDINSIPTNCHFRFTSPI